MLINALKPGWRRVHRTGLVVTVCLFVPLLQATGAQGLLAGESDWSQPAGGPNRPGVAWMDPGPYDVVSTYRFASKDSVPRSSIVMAVVPTPYGLTALTSPLGSIATSATGEGKCDWVRITDVRRGSMLTGPKEDCYRNFNDVIPLGNPDLSIDKNAVIAYDESNDALLTCTFATNDGPLLHSRDARTFEARWDKTPADLGAPPKLPSVPSLGPQYELGYFCRQGALDYGRGEMVIPVNSDQIDQDGTLSRLVRIRLADGFVVRSEPMFAEIATQSGMAGPSSRGMAAKGGVTLTDTGIITLGMVYGSTTDPVSALADHVISWFDRDGVPRGQESLPTGALRETAALSAWAASTQVEGALLAGNNITFIDPSGPTLSSAPLGVVTKPAYRYYNGLEPPALWWNDHLVVFDGETAYDMDPGTRQLRWPPWSEIGGWRIDSAIIVPPNDLYAFSSRTVAGNNETAAFRIELSTGRTLQRIPVSGPEGKGLGQVRVLPLPDQGILFLHDGEGEAFVLSKPSPGLKQQVDATDAYPSVGQEIEIRATSSSGAEPSRLVAAWGDDAIETLSPGRPARHSYSKEGLHIVRVTAIYPDGRTATTEVPIDVGATPPTRLTPLQRAFAPETQNMTFFVLGLIVTLLLSLLAVAANRRKHGRLHRELQTLRAIRLDGSNDPARAIRRLGAYRDALTLELESGRLHDAQYATIHAEAQRLLQHLRTKVLGPVAGRLSTGFEAVLDGALADGHIGATELRDLRSGLKREPHLGASDKRRLTLVFESLADPNAERQS